MTGLRSLFNIFLLASPILVLPCYLYGMDRIPGVVHLETDIGHGVLSPDEMVKRVKDANLKVAVITDMDNQRVEYGVPFLRNVLKKGKEIGAVLTYGAGNYLRALEDAEAKNPGLTVIPGIEAIPYYYWEGSYFDNNLRLMNFHKDLLVIGLEKPGDIDGIPSVHYNNPIIFDLQSLLNMWPLLVIPAGLFLAKQKRKELVKLKLFRFTKTSRPYMAPGIALIFIGLLLAAHNFPFGSRLYDQYDGDRGSLPYQNIIDYVEKRGGMTFWIHPDIESKLVIKGTEMYTPPFYDELLKTHDYTGFTAFFDGMKFTGKPGGVWDAVLKQYISGLRSKPVWAIGGMDYKDGAYMGESQTVFLADNNNRAEILKAIREGRMYAVCGNAKPVLDAFQIWDDKNGKWMDMGGTAAVIGKTRIRIKVSLPDDSRRTARLKLIREGIVIKEIPIEGSLDMDLDDEFSRTGEETYYRIDVDGLLISNPIFVKMEKS